MRPLSVYYNQEINTFLVNHAGRVITIYDIGKLFGIAYNKSATMNNANAGFKKTGIFPYNSNIFSDIDFVAASTTDRLLLPGIANTSDQSILKNTLLALKETSENDQFIINNISLASSINIESEEPTLSSTTKTDRTTLSHASISIIDQFVFENPLTFVETITATTLPFTSSLTNDKIKSEANVFIPESATNF